MKKKPILFILTALILALLFTACGGNIKADKKEIKIGATAGPYSDQIREGH